MGWEDVEHQLGTYFKDMVLDLIERSHPDYDRKMAEVLQSALTDMAIVLQLLLTRLMTGSPNFSLDQTLIERPLKKLGKGYKLPRETQIFQRFIAQILKDLCSAPDSEASP